MYRLNPRLESAPLELLVLEELPCGLDLLRLVLEEKLISLKDAQVPPPR